MAEEKFDVLYGGDLYDYLTNSSNVDGDGVTTDPASFSDPYMIEASDFDDIGKMTINDKENGVAEDGEAEDRQIVEEVTFANGVTETYGGSNKLDIDPDAKVTIAWIEGEGDDAVVKEATVWIMGTDFGPGPYIVSEEGQDLPPPGTEIQMIEYDTSFVQVFDAPAWADLVCFTRGTMILTGRGEVAVEALRVDDMVVTRDRGLQPVRWIGSRSVKAVGAAAPILIKAGALANDRDLLVSPNHRMLVEGWKAEALFGETEVLATARQLTVRDDVFVVEGGEVEYFHILFDRHEIITANGAPSESLNPGEAAKGALAEEARAEVLRLFPELESVGEVALVRPMVKDGEATLLS